MFCPVIMAGGSGSRLWPLSRELYPKQFLPLDQSQETMLQATLHRLEGLDYADPWVICNEEHRFVAAEQLRQIGLNDAQILLEPIGRNTAPAIALAALMALEQAEDALLLVLAADHSISDVEAFHESIAAAQALASDGHLVTFGVVPSSPATGYGYIKRGEAINHFGFEVERFVEKPNLEVATSYVASAEYLWNSGMFLFKASNFIEELNLYRPEIVRACRAAVAGRTQDMHFIRPCPSAFAACPNESVDYAVMENSHRVAVVPLDSGWNDVGSWAALWDIAEKDADNNVIKGDVYQEKVTNSYLCAEHRFLSVIGVQNLIVVETNDAVLVAHKDNVQDVKNIVSFLKAEKRREHLSHREIYRPWGRYDSVDQGSRYQVKRITVDPGCKLSVQMHHHRAEHWIVVSGTARVQNGEKSYLVTENQSTYIPVGQIHSLENPGVIPLELIEVQSGSYLGEDDIVRFEDLYGRVESIKK
ncbi:mannose-1-phosphate guanylyltransferase/mannose-6-phosphate isomerase [Pseudomonas monteilii]|uniref:mannose-1-phosphate guanylyltransferase/mannose-6-phosphate isomerase n=1 Tax=Pseudomonas monteilii TaxID=76759 RepID=UPI0018A9A3D2|nr:mannose-1-phosphate guanylyltransferase/mannose-6-phosphate isomerase [Pseudomonas monteilii]MBF8748659.1 mannose-1-phosphate guanylyltransferase/mannose-6-phosphate isomerase [Pseudomonas monteilii]